MSEHPAIINVNTPRGRLSKLLIFAGLNGPLFEESPKAQALMAVTDMSDVAAQGFLDAMEHHAPGTLTRVQAVITANETASDLRRIVRAQSETPKDKPQPPKAA
jgi:hypothetical protein